MHQIVYSAPPSPTTPITMLCYIQIGWLSTLENVFISICSVVTPEEGKY